MKMFTELTTEQEQEYRKWARMHYKPFEPIKGVWHPVVQDECVKINVSTGYSFHFDGETK